MADEYIYRIWADETSTPYLLRDQRVGSNSDTLKTHASTVIPAINEVQALALSGYTDSFGILHPGALTDDASESVSWSSPQDSKFDSGVAILFVSCQGAQVVNNSTATVRFKSWSDITQSWRTIYEESFTFEYLKNTFAFNIVGQIYPNMRYAIELERTSPSSSLPAVSVVALCSFKPFET